MLIQLYGQFGDVFFSGFKSNWGGQNNRNACLYITQHKLYQKWSQNSLNTIDLLTFTKEDFLQGY